MSLLGISGETGCGAGELARLLAARLNWSLATETDALSEKCLVDSVGEQGKMPARAWRWLAESVLVRRGAQGNVVFSVPGGQFLFPALPQVLRVHLTASLQARIGAVMTDQGIDRPRAREWLASQESIESKLRRERFGRTLFRAADLDLVLNSGKLKPDQQLNIIEAALRARGLFPGEPISAAAEAQMLFQIRLKLAGFGLEPPHQTAGRPEFSHPTEEIFAKLLDFYRIPWQYEPRSFPLQWDKDGKVIEAFTPDFYLPEFDLYVELTTMKQSLVTRKNHKVKLLRAIYPHVNIQVFYQKDIQDLILKYGLSRADSES